VGIVFIGLVAQVGWNGISDGLLYGNAKQLLWQGLAAVATPAYAFGMTFALLKLMGALMPLRTSEHEEAIGMDVTQHGEEAYASGEGAILVTTEAGMDGPRPVAQPGVACRAERRVGRRRGRFVRPRRAPLSVARGDALFCASASPPTRPSRSAEPSRRRQT
jgi:hypothetical protein